MSEHKNMNAGFNGWRKGGGVFLLLCLAAGALLLAQPGLAADKGVEFGIEDDLTVNGTEGVKNDADLEVKGYSVFGTTGEGAAAVTSGPGSVYLQGSLEVGGKSYLSGNVGIATTAPSRTLEVVGIVKATSFEGSGAALTGITATDSTKVLKAGDTMTGTLTNTAGVAISATGDAYLATGATGNVGIGTTGPGAKLEISAAGTDISAFDIQVPNGNPWLVRMLNRAYSTDLANAFTYYQSNTGYLEMRNMGYGANLVLYNGNVGIGTTGPGAKLEVNCGATQDGINVLGSNIPQIQVGADSNNNFQLYWNNGAGYFGTCYNAAPMYFAGKDIYFTPSSVQTMYLSSSGSVGIGGVVNPGATLEVDSSISTLSSLGVGYFLNTYDNYNVNPTVSYPVLTLARKSVDGFTYPSVMQVGISRWEDVGTNGRTQADFILTNGNSIYADTTVMTLRSSGNVGIGTTAPSRTLEVVGVVKATSFEGSGAALTDITGTDNTKVLKAGDTMTGTLTNTATTGLDVSGNAYFATAAGSVGVGTTSPSYTLHVKTAAGIQALESTSAGEVDFYMIPNGSHSWTFGANSVGWWAYDLGVNKYRIIADQSGNLQLGGDASLTPTMYVASSGSVGIGTTAPSRTLEVVGIVKATSFEGSGAALTGITADHTATADYAVLSGTASQTSYAVLAGTASNAVTVNNGVYTTGSYNNPSWLPSVSYAVLAGTASSAGTATDNTRVLKAGDTMTGVLTNTAWGVFGHLYTSSDTQFNVSSLTTYNQIMMGNHVGTGPWFGNGLAFTNSTVGYDVMGININGDTIFMGDATLGKNYLVVNATGEYSSDVDGYISAKNVNVYGGLALGAYAGLLAPPANGLIVSGRVGIGTTSPAATFEVGANHTLVVDTGTGSVGIGTTSPSRTLEVVGIVKATSFEGSGAALTGITATDSTKVLKAGDTMTGTLSIDAGTADTALRIRTDANTREALYVSKAGNVGIGTTNPTSKLTVAGTVELVSGSGGAVKFADGTLQTTSTSTDIKGASFSLPYATSEAVIRLPYNITITSVEVYCADGTSVIGQVSNNGNNLVSGTGITANAGSWAVASGALSNTAYTAFNNLRFFTPTVDGSVNSATVLIRYTRP
ncbi:MAG: hypothetical protein JW873_00790 [Candidatus Saganbacteria bacterium]|nr:hypothetical protein [Candidatus Saganbacteria bacterium]